MGKHNELGQLGENIAAEFLQANEYQILERNFRYNRYEVDILAEKNGILAVIEVKTRSSVAFGLPQEFVKPKQIGKLVEVVDHFIQSRNLELDVRFDIIAISKIGNRYEVEHLKEAFYHF